MTTSSVDPAPKAPPPVPDSAPEASAPIRYLLRLACGKSRTPDVVLRRGQARPVFGAGAGTSALWRIDADGVSSLHVLFAFNGVDLYVAAAPGADALLDGSPLPERWLPVRRVVQIELGRARIAVLPRTARTASPARPARPAQASPRGQAASTAASRPHEATDASDDAVTEPFARTAAADEATAVTSPDVLRALRAALTP